MRYYNITLDVYMNGKLVRTCILPAPAKINPDASVMLTPEGGFKGWTSNTQYCFEWNGTQQCNNVVNGSSYSGSDGIASTILGVHQEHIGDTIKVHCGYYDNYGTQWLDSIRIKIDE